MSTAPHCLDCDYLLIGLTERRCPECGRAFDPDDDATFRVDTVYHTGPAWAVLGVWLATVFIATAGFEAVIVFSGRSDNALEEVLAMGLGLMVLTAPIGLTAMARADRRANPDRR